MGAPEAEVKYLAYVNEITQPGGKRFANLKEPSLISPPRFLKLGRITTLKTGDKPVSSNVIKPRSIFA